MKIDIYGQGGEFVLGGVDKKQVNYIYDKLKNADEDGGRKHIDNDVFETNEIQLPWNEIDDITHMYGVTPDRFYLSSENENFENIDVDTKGLGAYEIDYENHGSAAQDIDTSDAMKAYSSAIGRVETRINGR